MPCDLVPHFQVLHFHALQFGPAFSGPAFSGPAFSAPPSAAHHFLLVFHGNSEPISYRFRDERRLLRNFPTPCI